MSTFLGIVKLQDGTAQSIVNAIKKLLCDVQVNPQNCVCELVKKELELPNLLMVRCVCHSLQLALPHAVAETLPKNINFFGARYLQLVVTFLQMTTNVQNSV